MPPYWLLVDIHDLAKVAAFTFAAGCGWVWLIGREFANHRSTADASAPEAPALASGAGTRAVELPHGGARMCPRPAEAGAETERDLSCGGSFALSAVPTDGPTP